MSKRNLCLYWTLKLPTAKTVTGDVALATAPWKREYGLCRLTVFEIAMGETTLVVFIIDLNIFISLAHYLHK